MNNALLGRLIQGAHRLTNDALRLLEAIPRHKWQRLPDLRTCGSADRLVAQAPLFGLADTLSADRL